MAGSEKRQRLKGYFVRCSAKELQEIDAKADAAGYTPPAFLRFAALGSAGARAKRKPPVDLVALRQLLGHLGKIGSNLNQIARALNAGGTPDIPELKTALTDYQKIRDAIFKLLGMNASNDHQGK